MYEYPVLSTLFEAINAPHKSLCVRYIHTLKGPGTEGCSVVDHTSGLSIQPQFFTSKMLMINWFKGMPHSCLHLIPCVHHGVSALGAKPGGCITRQQYHCADNMELRQYA